MRQHQPDRRHSDPISNAYAYQRHLAFQGYDIKTEVDAYARRVAHILVAEWQFRGGRNFTDVLMRLGGFTLIIRDVLGVAPATDATPMGVPTNPAWYRYQALRGELLYDIRNKASGYLDAFRTRN